MASTWFPSWAKSHPEEALYSLFFTCVFGFDRSIRWKVSKLIELRKVQEEQKKDIKTLEKLSGRYLSAIRALLKLKSGKELTKDMVEAFISKIYVYPGKRIEVLFTFTADCMEGVK